MIPISSSEKKMQMFRAVTRKEWEEAARNEWEGVKPSEITALPTHGTAIEPYYDRSDLPSHSNSQLYASEEEFLGARIWLNMPLISCKSDLEANQKACEWLASGADGILFELSDSSNPETLLKGIELPFCNISFLADERQEFFFQRFLMYIKTKKYAPESVSGTIFWKTPPANLPDLISQFIPSAQFHAGGIIEGKERKSAADDIAALLAKAVKQIDIVSPLHALAKGKGSGEHIIDIKDAVHSIAFSASVSTDLFLEIAKLKALRMLWHQVACSYTPEYTAKPFIHAFSKIWTKSEYEPHSNMLKGTTSAMSAILGGCDSLTTQAEDQTSEWMTRIARNISSILREEAHFSTVADPTAGSYYLEKLIDRLAQDAWKKFQDLV